MHTSEQDGYQYAVLRPYVLSKEHNQRAFCGALMAVLEELSRDLHQHGRPHAQDCSSFQVQITNMLTCLVATVGAEKRQII